MIATVEMKLYIIRPKDEEIDENKLLIFDTLKGKWSYGQPPPEDQEIDCSSKVKKSRPEACYSLLHYINGRERRKFTTNVQQVKGQQIQGSGGHR